MQELWTLSYLGTGDAAPATVIDVQAGTYSETVTEPDFIALNVLFGQTGIVSVVGGTGPTYYWMTPGGTASDYSLYFQLNSGTLSGGSTVNTWLPLESAASFLLTRNTVGTSTVTATISIRRDSDGVVLDSANITIEATVIAGETGGGGGGDYGGENDPGAGGNGEHLP